MRVSGRSCSDCSIAWASSDEEVATTSTGPRASRSREIRRDPPSPHPLDRWVDGIRRGTNDAYRAVYDETASDLLSFANGMVRNRASAEDAVQQAFLELVASAHRFRGAGESLRVWLFRAVRYRCIDQLRRASRREIPAERLPETLAPDPTADPIDPRLLAALDGLGERARAMVVMRHVVGMSGAEIAGVMGLNRPAVYASIQRSEKRLRRALMEEER